MDATGTLHAPTSDPHARGILETQTSGHVIIAFPGTSYQMQLNVDLPVNTQPGKKIVGTIRGQARRIDKVGTGGRYVEPVFGRPRRVQGSVIAVDLANQSITIDAGVPMVCKTDGRQRAEDFLVGDFVTMEILAGATFSPA